MTVGASILQRTACTRGRTTGHVGLSSKLRPRTEHFFIKNLKKQTPKIGYRNRRDVLRRPFASPSCSAPPWPCWCEDAVWFCSCGRTDPGIEPARQFGVKATPSCEEAKGYNKLAVSSNMQRLGGRKCLRKLKRSKPNGDDVMSVDNITLLAARELGNVPPSRTR